MKKETPCKNNKFKLQEAFEQVPESIEQLNKWSTTKVAVVSTQWALAFVSAWLLSSAKDLNLVGAVTAFSIAAMIFCFGIFVCRLERENAKTEKEAGAGQVEPDAEPKHARANGDSSGEDGSGQPDRGDP